MIEGPVVWGVYNFYWLDYIVPINIGSPAIGDYLDVARA